MIRRILIAIPILFVAWIAVLAIVMRLGGATTAAFVPFPNENFIAALPADVSVTGLSRISMTLRSDAPDLTRRLYKAGAVLVLPAGLEACIPSFLRKDG